MKLTPQILRLVALSVRRDTLEAMSSPTPIASPTQTPSDPSADADGGPDIDGWLTTANPRVRHLERVPSRAGRPVDWPDWLPAAVRESLAAGGITAPWAHQVEAAELAHAGRHVVLATPTASGKSLGYLMPVLAATWGGSPVSPPDRIGPVRARQLLVAPKRAHTTLYLSPTKALAHDQLRAARELAPAGWRGCALDGDSTQAERAWAREHGTFVVSNPDMLHRSVLPNHPRWKGLLQSLRYVVIDEAHRYRGVFGTHVAAVLRRLRRMCAAYGSDPVFVFASATSTNPAESTSRLIGVPETEVAVVADDASPHGSVTFGLWEPESGSCDDDAARLLTRLVDQGQQTVAFIASRRMAEIVAVRAQERSPHRIRAYRAGYLAEDRRALERQLQSGELRGVAATNALELGVDVAGLDAVVISGFPGTLSALRQQAGRAGRSGNSATVLLVARKNPLDAYLFDHPDLVFGPPVEPTVLYPDNPTVLAPHLAAAAQELPLTTADEVYFGPTMRALADQLVAQDVLVARAAGWYWTRPERAVDAIDLRSSGGHPVQIIEDGTGRVIGQVDPSAADQAVHEGAVYLHQGETFLVDSLDHDLGEAIVRADRPGYVTQPLSSSQVRIRRRRETRPLGVGTVSWGEVDVTGQVVGYLRRDEETLQVWDSTPLDLPARTLRTQAVWWTVPLDQLDDTTWPTVRLGSAAHAAEHTAIGMLPLLAPCDRWDIGGLSMVLHPDTGTCTIFVHDGHPGGAGFARHGYRVIDQWLAATMERLQSCTCDEGCPACVVSPKCGNANDMLDKRAAIDLLRFWVP